MLEGLKKQLLYGSAWNDFQNNIEQPTRQLFPEAASGSSSQSLVVLLLWQQPLDPLEQEDRQTLSSSIQAQSHLYHCHSLVSHQRSSRKESGKLLKENDP